MTSKFVRKYRTLFSYDASDNGEVTIREGDIVLVHPKPDGQWPNAEKWMKGTNQRTGKSGEFPGNYTEFIDEEEVPPTPPPRAKPRPRSTVDPDQVGGLEPPIPARRRGSNQRSVSRLSPSPGPQQPLPTPAPPTPVAPATATQDKKAHSWVEDVFKVPFKCSFCEWHSTRDVCVCVCGTKCVGGVWC